MVSRAAWLIAVIGALSAFACNEVEDDLEVWSTDGLEGVYMDQEPDNAVATTPTPWFSDGDALDVRQATLVGSIGHIAGLNHTATSLQGYGDSYFTMVSAMVETEEGVAMAILDIGGGLDALTPGETYVFSGWDYMGDVSVSVVGCAGPEQDMWTFDQLADEVTVTVEEEGEPGLVTVNFTASFDSLAYDMSGAEVERSQVSGSITFAPAAQ